jgi:hypothetical protein
MTGNAYVSSVASHCFACLPGLPAGSLRADVGARAIILRDDVAKEAPWMELRGSQGGRERPVPTPCAAFRYRAPCKLKFAQNPLPLLVQWEMTVQVWKS